MLLDGTQQVTGRIEVLSKRLLDDDTVVAPLDVTLLFEVFRYGDEDTRRKSEVEYTVAYVLVRVLGFDLFQCLVQLLERLRVVVPAGNVAGESFELLEGSLNLSVAFGLLDVRSDTLVIFSVIHLSTRIPNDFDIIGEEAHTIETEEGRICLERGERMNQG